MGEEESRAGERREGSWVVTDTFGERFVDVAMPTRHDADAKIRVGARLVMKEFRKGDRPQFPRLFVELQVNRMQLSVDVPVSSQDTTRGNCAIELLTSMLEVTDPALIERARNAHHTVVAERRSAELERIKGKPRSGPGSGLRATGKTERKRRREKEGKEKMHAAQEKK